MEGYVHELKCFFPYYPMMWEIDREFTKRFLKTCWAAHILDWSILDMNRHGKYDVMFDDQRKNEYVGSEVFFVGKGLTFCNIGSDLIYAGAMLHNLTGEEEPLGWAKRMAHRYDETRNPKTGLVGYQYSQVKSDRAQRQFGQELGPNVLEGTLIEPNRSVTRYALMGICQLRLGEMLGKKGSEFTKWALEDLTAYGKNVYNPENNTVIAMITDGRKLSPADVKREGYYGSPENIAPKKIDITFLWAYALAYRIGENDFHWQMARDIAKGYELGDIGETPGGETAINMNTECSEPRGLLGILEIYRKTGNGEFLGLAKKIGDNILKDRFYKGFFVESKKHIYTRFDSMEPLALLHLAGVIKGKSELIPQTWPSNAFFHNRYDGAGRTTDISFIYSQQSQ